MRFIPGHDAFPGLVRIDIQVHLSVFGFVRVECIGVGTVRRGHFSQRNFSRQNGLQRRVAARKNVQLQHTERAHVQRGNGDQFFMQHLFRMRFGKLVKTRAIPFQQALKIGRQGVVFFRGQFPGPNGLHHVIHARALLAFHLSEQTFRCQKTGLERFKIVFTMRPCQAVGHFGVGLGKDVWHPETVADNVDVRGIDLRKNDCGKNEQEEKCRGVFVHWWILIDLGICSAYADRGGMGTQIVRIMRMKMDFGWPDGHLF